MEELKQYLSKTPVFSKIPSDGVDQLVQRAVRKTFHKGEFICRQDEIWPWVTLIESGRVEWSLISADGKRQVVFDLHEGDVIWGHSLFDGKPMPASLEVMETSDVFLWNSEIIVPVISKSPEAMWDITRVLVAAMRRVRDVVYGFAFHPVSGRLARFILRHYQPCPGQAFTRELTLDEMAAIVGTTRELVCKVLYYYAEIGAIKVKRNEFIFLNVDILRDIAEIS